MFVRDYMSTDPITIGPDQTVEDALELLKDHSIRRLPVISKGKLSYLSHLGFCCCDLRSRRRHS